MSLYRPAVFVLERSTDSWRQPAGKRLPVRAKDFLLSLCCSIRYPILFVSNIPPPPPPSLFFFLLQTSRGSVSCCLPSSEFAPQPPVWQSEGPNVPIEAAPVAASGRTCYKKRVYVRVVQEWLRQLYGESRGARAGARLFFLDAFSRLTAAGVFLGLHVGPFPRSHGLGGRQAGRPAANPQLCRSTFPPPWVCTGARRPLPVGTWELGPICGPPRRCTCTRAVRKVHALLSSRWHPTGVCSPAPGIWPLLEQKLTRPS